MLYIRPKKGGSRTPELINHKIKMKKLLFAFCAVVIIVLSGCSKYDDGPLTDRVDNLEKRVITLEELCKQMNTNISSLQTLVSALQENDFITSVKPVNEGNVTVGYTISFTKSPSITIYHGKDGIDGSDGNDGVTPVIGVKQDADSQYYWTINGEWLRDSDGAMINANGTSGEDGNDGNDGVDGKDGISPVLKIEEGDWYISLDKGNTWENLGRATGADGKDGNDGDSMFSSIDTSNSDVVTFVLSDGTMFTLPRHAELIIAFDEDGLIGMEPNATRTIGYTITGNTNGLHVEVLSSGNVKAKIDSNNSSTGTLTITTGGTVDEYDKVILLVSNGQATIMRSISFEEAGILRVTNDAAYDIPSEGGTVEIEIETNIEYSLSIPEESKSWISVVTSRAVRHETIKLNIEENDGVPRVSVLTLSDAEGDKTVNIVVTQRDSSGAGIIPADMEVAFPDSSFRDYVLSKFDIDGDGVISLEEALQVEEIMLEAQDNVGEDARSRSVVSSRSGSMDDETPIGRAIKADQISLDMDINGHAIAISLDGLQYFPRLTRLYLYRIPIKTLDLSRNKALDYLYCNFNQLESIDVSGCTVLREIDCRYNDLTSLDVSKCTMLSILNCRQNRLTNLDLSENAALTKLICDTNKLISLDVSGCAALTELYCGFNIGITSLDVSKCTVLSILSCSECMLTNLDLSKNTALTVLNCFGNKLSGLDVSGCTALTWLSCGYNKGIQELDLSSNTELKVLNYSGNSQLVYLNFPSNNALTELYCQDLQLTSLDVRRFSSLTALHCNDNNLANLDVSGLTSLERLYCYRNQLTSLNVSGCDALMSISCDDNQLKELNVSDCVSLEILGCAHNNLTNLNVSGLTSLRQLMCGANQLTDLDVGGCTVLRSLTCWTNKLKSLDLSDCPSLGYLVCAENQLTSLDLSKTVIGVPSTDLGIIGNKYPLGCYNMPTLETLYLRKGWSIGGITEDNGRSTEYIPENTQIVFVD